MKLGTRSLLYGAHCWFIHPWFVWLAWIKLYGFPWHPAYYLCFFAHDWGYWGLDQMDDEVGETHPRLGAAIVQSIFGPEWGEFCLCHSRWYATKLGKPISRLCVADKLAIVLTPSWLYLPMVFVTGELAGYMALNHESRFQGDYSSPYTWHQSVKTYLRKWVAAHRDSNTDTWLTGETR